MQVAGANRRWRCQFRCRGSRRESAVAQLFSLGHSIMLWLIELIFPRRLHRVAYFLRGILSVIVGHILYSCSTTMNPQYWWAAVITETIYCVLFIDLPRIHDLGMSGWWLLLIVVPGANIWLALILTFRAPVYVVEAVVYQVAGANRRWRWPFRCRGSRRESAVAQLSTLGRSVIAKIDLTIITLYHKVSPYEKHNHRKHSVLGTTSACL